LPNNDTRMAALWLTPCLLIAYCGMNDDLYRAKARIVTDEMVLAAAHALAHEVSQADLNEGRVLSHV
jgi:malic enzyme